MISLLHTGSQDMAETQHEEEVVQEDLITLQSNLLMSPPGQSHFATEATLEEDGYDSDNKINPMSTIINNDSMEDNDAALLEVSEELAASGEQETQEYGGNFVDIPEDSLKNEGGRVKRRTSKAWTIYTRPEGCPFGAFEGGTCKASPCIDWSRPICLYQ